MALIPLNAGGFRQAVRCAGIMDSIEAMVSSVPQESPISLFQPFRRDIKVAVDSCISQQESQNNAEKPWTVAKL